MSFDPVDQAALGMLIAALAVALILLLVGVR